MLEFENAKTHYLYLKCYYHYKLKLFFKNELLNALLYRTIGTMNYEKNKFYFIAPEVDLEQYEETTALFEEVFYIEDIH